jgi:choline dehydrogenase
MASTTAAAVLASTTTGQSWETRDGVGATSIPSSKRYVASNLKNAVANLGKATRFNPPDKSKGFDLSYKTWDPSAYSDGPLELGFQGYVPLSGVGFINASSEALRIPIVHDYNTGNSTGVKQGTATVDARLRRSSSYDGFYKQAANRTNLDVLFYAPVQQIITDTSGATPVVTGVYFMDHPTGRIHQVKAKKEVIISMGAFHSPQLLMVSVRMQPSHSPS